MIISRRNLLRQVAATGAVTMALPSLSNAAAPNTLDGPIRLDKNESAYGPSEQVVAAIERAVKNVAGRYTPVVAERLRANIAAFHSVPTDQVMVGCGSGEILRQAVEAFTQSGRHILAAVPTCELIEQYGARAGAELRSVPLDHRYMHNLTAMADRADASTGLVYICNPHNPTGTVTSRHDIENLLRKLPPAAHVMIDEAYHHYVNASSDYVSFLDHPVNDPRVIVTRSFSKIYGLAGLRVGYGVAAPDVCRLLSAGLLQDSVNSVGAVAALAALEDSAHIRTIVKQNADDRQEFVNQAGGRMVKPIDSHTNFVTFDTDLPALRVIDHFRKHGIAIAGSFPYFAKFVRVSLGTTEEMREFWRVWDLLPRPKMSM
jgi:histidinol-phosphate aminotransferase